MVNRCLWQPVVKDFWSTSEKDKFLEVHFLTMYRPKELLEGCCAATAAQRSSHQHNICKQRKTLLAALPLKCGEELRSHQQPVMLRRWAAKSDTTLSSRSAGGSLPEHTTLPRPSQELTEEQVSNNWQFDYSLPHCNGQSRPLNCNKAGNFPL